MTTDAFVSRHNMRTRLIGDLGRLRQSVALALAKVAWVLFYVITFVVLIGVPFGLTIWIAYRMFSG